MLLSAKTEWAQQRKYFKWSIPSKGKSIDPYMWVRYVSDREKSWLQFSWDLWIVTVETANVLNQCTCENLSYGVCSPLVVCLYLHLHSPSRHRLLHCPHLLSFTSSLQPPWISLFCPLFFFLFYFIFSQFPCAFHFLFFSFSLWSSIFLCSIPSPALL